jgi:hypothetical protein
VAKKKSPATKSKTSSVSTARELTPEGQAKYERVVHFFEKVLRHSKGQNAGKPFTLLPWQHHVLRELFGRLNPDGTRQHRVGYIELPKKQGKSTTLAGIALYMTAFDSEPGAEVYGAACDREQAGIIYREAASMVRASPALSRHLEVIDSRKTIVHKASNSFYRVLSADAFRAEGLNIHALLFDELHAQRDRRLWAFAPGREAGGEGPAQKEMHSGTVERLADRHSSCPSPRLASTAKASAGNSTSTPSGARLTRPQIQPSSAASTPPRPSAVRTGRGRKNTSGTKPTQAWARRSRWSHSRPTPARPSNRLPSSTPSCVIG